MLATGTSTSGSGPVKLAYTRYGSKKDKEMPPLVIAHGLFGQKTNWHSLCKMLHSKLHNQIYAVDMRNHGESPWCKEMNYVLMADDLAEFIYSVVLPETGFKKSHLLGHSMGGKAAMMLALGKEHKLIDHLIIEDIAPKTYDRSTHGHFPAYVDAMKMVNLKMTKKEIGERMADVVKDREVRNFLLMNLVEKSPGQFHWKINLDAISDNLSRLIAFPKVELLKTQPFKGPTLFLHGGESNYVKLSDRDMIHELFPNAEFESVDAGHWLHSEQPAILMTSMERFLGVTTGELPKKQ